MKRSKFDNAVEDLIDKCGDLDGNDPEILILQAAVRTLWDLMTRDQRKAAAPLLRIAFNENKDSRF